MNRSPRLYRVLLRLLPRSLRARHGAEMTDLMAQELSAARERGVLPWLVAYAHATWDLVRHAPHEHWRRRHEPRMYRKGDGMHSVMGDLRFAGRSFARQKGATALLLLVLTLAVAANSAVFGLIDGLFLRPLPFPEPERLVYLNEQAPRWNLEFTGINYPDFHAWRANTTRFSSMGLMEETSVNVSDGASAERIPAARVTYDLPSTLGVRPVLGRTFSREEDRPHPPPLVVIGYGLWQQRFGGARDVVGRTLRINSVVHTVIGVLPPEAAFPEDARLWLALGGDPNQEGSSYSYDGFARLKPGVTLEQARADLLHAHEPVWRQFDSTHVVSPRIMPLRDRYVADLRVMGKALGAGVLLVLLIACANIAGAMLARAVFRQHELGIRTALGASGARLTRQLLTESLLLALVAGAIGTLLGWRGLHLLVNLASTELPAWAHFSADWRGILFAVAVVLLTAMLFGLAPALQARKVDVRSALSSGGLRTSGSVPQRHLLDALVVGEVAIAAVLLSGGGLLLRAYRNLLHVEPGFRVENVATFGVVLPSVRYDAPRQHALYEDIISKLGALPGVIDAGGITCTPLTCHWGYFLDAEQAAPRDPAAPDPVTLVRIATAGYFHAAGTPLASGRYFTASEGDTVGFRPVVVNESLAKRFWHTAGEAVGKRFRFRGNSTDRWLTVVGVTKDERHYGLDQPPRPGLYIPLRAWGGLESLRFAVHTRGDPASLFAQIRVLVRAEDPELPVYQLRTMHDMVSASLSTRRALVGSLTVFAAIAFVLAVSGIYAVISYSVGRRRQELGIRMALGAQRGQVLRLVVGHGVRLVTIGLVVGVPAALLSSRVLSSLLVGISGHDPATYLLVAAAMFCTGVFAAAVPARRAARVAPSEALTEST